MAASPLYLDNATVLPPLPQVVKAMMPLYENAWGNSSSPHEKGQELYQIIQRAYEAVEKNLNLLPDARFILTSSGAEATTQAIFSAYRHGYYESGKTHIAIAQFHDAASIMAAQALTQDSQATVTYIQSTKEGLITSEKVIDALTPRTSSVVFPLVHPLTGVVQPIEEIEKICRSRAIPMVVDISHAIGTIPLDLSMYPTAYYTIRGEAIGAPIGTGALIAASEKVHLSSLIYGDEHPLLHRGGPINIAGLVAFETALSAAKGKEILYCTEVLRLRDAFEREITRKLGDNVIFPFSSVDGRAPHISCIAFKGVKNEALLYHLNKKKLYATIGGGGFQNLVDVLEGAGFGSEIAFSAISFCFSDQIKEEEIFEAVERLHSCYTVLSRITPWKKFK